MDAVRSGISVTQTAYGDLANILVTVSFVSLVETTLAVAQPGSHSWGESSRCPEVAGDLRLSQQGFLLGAELSGGPRATPSMQE